MMHPRRLEHDWFSEPLPGNVELGPRSWLYSSYAFRHFHSQRPTGLRVGHDTGLYDGTFFDLGPNGEVEIGNYCTLVGAIINTNGRIVIHDFVLIAHEVVLADSFAGIPGTALEGRPASDPAIELGENSWVGARAVLLEGARVGAGAIIGAAAVVDFEVPPYSVVAGNPARVVRKLVPPPTA